MHFKQFYVGCLAHASYLIGDGGEAVVVDPSRDVQMYVDEAATHIRELVDPDANIIWGSAFNEGLNGKIRVSVVATGIDQDIQDIAAHFILRIDPDHNLPISADLVTEALWLANKLLGYTKA